MSTVREISHLQTDQEDQSNTSIPLEVWFKSASGCDLKASVCSAPLLMVVVLLLFYFFFENLVKMMKRERAAGPLLQTMCVRVLTMLHRVTHQFKSNDWQSARNKSSRWCSVCLSSPVPPADLPCDNAWVTCVCVCVCGSGVTCPPRDNHLKKHHGFTVLHIFSPPPGRRGLQLCPGLVGWSVSRTGQGPGWRMGLGPEQIPLRGDRSRNFFAPPFFFFF